MVPCDYCGEDIVEATDKTWSIPTPIRDDTVGMLCSPECQLSYSKYIVGPGHLEREPLMRNQHRGVLYSYAPPPGSVKKYNGSSYTPRSVWLPKLRK